MAINKYNWKLCADVFTFWDKLKISKFLFTESIWTYGNYIAAYEESWNKLIGHGVQSVMVSSGSTANELIALRRKWELQQVGQWPRRNKVIFPVNTWVSSVTPWIHAGFEPVFVDVEPNNLNVSSRALKKAFEKDEERSIGTVFYTALLGFFGDLDNCMTVTKAYGAKFLMDNCEASFSTLYRNISLEGIPLVALTTSSTSIFYSHFTTSGTEGGLIFTTDEEEYDWFRMMRSHGLTRGMPEKYKNPDVHPSFDFAFLGSNYRSSNLQAYMASLDLQRAFEFSSKERYALFDAFYLKISEHNKNIKMFYQADKNGDLDGEVVPLALPIIFKSRDMRIKAEMFCKLNGVETRPIIGGCLLAHNAFKEYGDVKDFPVAMNSHENGIYVGLNQNVTKDMVIRLAADLSNL
jgi:dTDP-4-amino-4,6-dideoxygalactose transaminase